MTQEAVNPAIPEWAMQKARKLRSKPLQDETIARAFMAVREQEREHSAKLFWAAKEFIDDWKKGDFSLSTLAALDAQSLDDALTVYAETRKEDE